MSREKSSPNLAAHIFFDSQPREKNEFVISEQTPVTAPLRCALGAGIITDHLASVVEQANHSSI